MDGMSFSAQLNEAYIACKLLPRLLLANINIVIILTILTMLACYTLMMPIVTIVMVSRVLSVCPIFIPLPVAMTTISVKMTTTPVKMTTKMTMMMTTTTMPPLEKGYTTKTIQHSP